MHYVDLSHTIEHGMVTYKGLPAPIICDFLSREASKKQYSEITTFQIGKIELVANTGTYVDAPFHRHIDGKDLSELSLESLVNLQGLVFRTRERANGSELFRNADVRGKAMLVNRGWAHCKDGTIVLKAMDQCGRTCCCTSILESLWKVTQRRGAVSPERPTKGNVRG
jgi:kynurenine formamidase